MTLRLSGWDLAGAGSGAEVHRLEQLEERRRNTDSVLGTSGAAGHLGGQAHELITNSGPRPGSSYVVV